MRIVIGADHRGFVLKETVKAYLKENGHEVLDVGNRKFNPSDDFPDFSHGVVSAIKNLGCDRGIVFCKTGAGTCMVANRYADIRAVECASLRDVIQAREHLDMNVLAIGASKVSSTDAKLLAKAFLSTKALGGKYHRRRVKIDNRSI